MDEFVHAAGGEQGVVDVSAALIGLVDRRQLDLALAKRPWGTSRGQLVRREQLVWAAADAFELAMGDTLPLALFRGSTVSRVAALEALRGTDQAWRIVYTSLLHVDTSPLDLAIEHICGRKPS